MPFYKEISINQNTTAYLWKITEDIGWFNKHTKLNKISETRLKTMLSEAHQCGFLAVRMLLQHIGLSDFDLFYDETGKPFIKVKSWKLEVGSSESLLNSTIPQSYSLPISQFPSLPIQNPQPATPNSQLISISHSHQFSCICISTEPIGIDLEINKPKTLKIQFSMFQKKKIVLVSFFLNYHFIVPSIITSLCIGTNRMNIEIEYGV